MPNETEFEFFLDHTESPVNKGGSLWNKPLPMDRRGSQPASVRPVTYGDYFCAVRTFLARKRFASIIAAVSERLKRDVGAADIEKIQILLMKHGEFYHPARVEAHVGGGSVPFVLNVAVSEAGRRTIKGEYQILKCLRSEISEAFLPAVYTQGDIRIPDSFEFSMFLGEWLRGFHEFHISLDPADGIN